MTRDEELGDVREQIDRACRVVTALATSKNLWRTGDLVENWPRLAS